MVLKTFVFRHATCVPVTGGRADKANNPHGGPTKMHLPYQPPGSKSENSHGLDRRDSVKTCMMAAASDGWICTWHADSNNSQEEQAKAGVCLMVVRY